MLAHKEPLIKTLYGSTNDVSTIPDYTPNFLYPFKKLHSNRSFTSALHNGPFYEDGHLILANSFNEHAAKTDTEHKVWNKRVLKHLPGSYLVDIQRIWEGYDGRWLQNAPLLLRFETIDIVLSPEVNGKGIYIWTGYLDTSMSIYATRNNSETGKEANKQSCLQWLPYRRDARLVGKQVDKAHLFSLISSEELLKPAFLKKPVFNKKEGKTANVSSSVFTLLLENNLCCTFLNKEGNLIMCVH